MITQFKIFEYNNILQYSINTHTGLFDIEDNKNTIELCKEDLFSILKIIDSDYDYFYSTIFNMKKESNYLRLEIDDVYVDIPSTQYTNLTKEINENIERVADFVDFAGSKYESIFLTKKDKTKNKFNL